MKVGIFGANGRVGRCLIAHLKKTSIEPVAFVRKEEQIGSFGEGVEVKLLSVEDSSANDLAGFLKGLNAVVFTAGAGGKGGAERTIQVDLDGAAKTFEACEKAGVKRYIMVSAFKAVDRDYWWNNQLRNYYICKKHADELLRNTKLDYTILQPGMLLDDTGNGKIVKPLEAEKLVDTGSKKAEIPRQDVAQSIVQALQSDGTIGKTLPLISGDVDIKSALS